MIIMVLLTSSLASSSILRTYMYVVECLFGVVVSSSRRACVCAHACSMRKFSAKHIRRNRKLAMHACAVAMPRNATDATLRHFPLVGTSITATKGS